MILKMTCNTSWILTGDIAVHCQYVDPPGHHSAPSSEPLNPSSVTITYYQALPANMQNIIMQTNLESLDMNQ